MKVKEGNSLKLSLSNWKIVSTQQILASSNIIREGKHSCIKCSSCVLDSTV